MQTQLPLSLDHLPEELMYLASTLSSQAAFPVRVVSHLIPPSQATCLPTPLIPEIYGMTPQLFTSMVSIQNLLARQKGQCLTHSHDLPLIPKLS